MSWIKTAFIVVGVFVSIVYFYFVGERLRRYFLKLCSKFFPGLGLKHQQDEDADAGGRGEDMQRRRTSPAMPAPSAPSAPPSAQPVTGGAVALVTLAHAEFVDMEPAAPNAIVDTPPQRLPNALVKEV
jgi:hypothetical protein